MLLAMTLTNLKDERTGLIRMDQYWNLPAYRDLLNYFQLLQVLDLVFSVLRFTNNQVVTTFLQVFSRVAMVIMIFPAVKKPNGPQDLSCLGVFLCMINWSMIEVIRFGFYASKAAFGDNALTNLFGHLRYNVFIFAYILGVAGENVAIYYTYQNLNAIEAAK